MLKRDISRPSRNKTLIADSSVSLEDIEEFKASCCDEYEIDQFAEIVRSTNSNYKEIEDNSIICILYVKKNYKKTTSQYISSVITSINLALTTTSTNIPAVNSIIGTTTKNVDYISNTFVRFFPPNIALPRSETKNDTKVIVKEKTHSEKELLNMLTDIGIPKNLSTGVDDIVKDGFTFSGATGLFTSSLEYILKKNKNHDEFGSDFYGTEE